MPITGRYFARGERLLPAKHKYSVPLLGDQQELEKGCRNHA